MKNILINNNEYEIIEDIRNGYDEEELKSKMTDYFDSFDYVVGDWAYGKLRLKGFCEKSSKQCKNFNCITDLKKYLKDNCAYNCKYFVIKKVYKSK